MKGSPLLRIFILAIGLVGTAILFAAITDQKSSRIPIQDNFPIKLPNEVKNSTPSRFVLQLSSSATVSITNSQGTELLFKEGTNFQGNFLLAKEDEVLFLEITWEKPPTGQNFAKLTLEPLRSKASTYYFDSSTDIDDFIELPVLP